MNMKKSVTALAVAAGLGAPFVAVADTDVYGSVRIAVQNVNDDGAAQYGQDEGFGLFSPGSRLGFRGEEDFGGLTAFGHYELSIDATEMTVGDGNRLAYVGLRGDFGEVQAGRIWSSWYEVIGWTVDRSWFYGGTGYYGYPTFNNHVGASTRSSDTIKYTYGSGGYGTDPFTLSLEAQMDGSSAGGAADGAAITTTGGTPTGETADPADIDAFTAAGQGTFGDFTIGAAHRITSSSLEGNQAEPSQTAVSFRWHPSAPFYIGAVYGMTDRDTDNNDSPSFIEVLGTMDFGGGLSGQLSLSSMDNDMDDDTGDTTGVFMQLNQALSSRTNVFGELQSLSVDGGDGDDTDPRVLMIGMEHSF